MRAVLQAISDELLRLKSEGEQTVPVSDETLAGLRALVAAQSGATTAAPGASASGANARLAPSAAGGAASASSGASVARAAPPPLAFNPEPVAAKPAVKLPTPVAAPPLPPPPVVTLPEGDKATRWAALKDMATNHPVCLANVRPGKKAVLGVGSLDAKIFFVGEAPGAEEEIQGEPFVGPAGQLLTKMIGAMGLKREQVYIGNIMCWRPQLGTTPVGAEQVGNRPPTADEMAFCLPFLCASIDIVQPDLIIALGGTAAKALLGEANFTTVGAARGRWLEFAGKPMMVTYHPSYLLQNDTKRSKRMAWEDLLKVMERVALPISEKQRGYFL